MKTQKLTIPSRQGHTLKAILHLPENRESIKGYAVFVHCFTCTKESFAASYISKALSDLSIATVRFDFTGLGESEGEFYQSDFIQNQLDIMDVCAFLQLRNMTPTLLIGHSLGGAAVVMIAKDIQEIRAVVTIGAPSDPFHVTHLFEDKMCDIEKNKKAKVNIGGRPFSISKDFVDALKQADLKQSVIEMKKPLLILHAPKDQIVSIEHAKELFSCAKHPKSFISLDTADHLLSKKEDALYAATLIQSWSKRYLN